MRPKRLQWQVYDFQDETYMDFDIFQIMQETILAT